MSELAVSELQAGDLDEMMLLERRAFSPDIQAERETYARRFALGHISLGLRSRGQLVGIASFRYGTYSPDAPAAFPRTFDEFSNAPQFPRGTSMILYNVGVDAGERSLKSLRCLMRAAFARALADGCKDVFGDGPLTSLVGRGSIPPSPLLQHAIRRYVEAGVFPSEKEFLADPLLATYHRVTGCRFLWLMPDFLVKDSASAGWRVILYTTAAAICGRFSGLHSRD